MRVAVVVRECVGPIVGTCLAESGKDVASADVDRGPAQPGRDNPEFAKERKGAPSPPGCSAPRSSRYPARSWLNCRVG